MLCPRCQVEIKERPRDGHCWNCGHNLEYHSSVVLEMPRATSAVQRPVLAQVENTIPANASPISAPQQEVIHTSLPVSSSSLTPQMDIFIPQELNFVAGNCEVLPIKIQNQTPLRFASLVIKAYIWEKAAPVHRKISQAIPAGGETIVGLPIYPETTGHLLLTSILLDFYEESGVLVKFKTGEDIIIPVVSKETKPAAKVNQISLQGYSQLLGHVVLNDPTESWRPVACTYVKARAERVMSFDLPPHPSPLDYCLLDIQSAEKRNYFYLCSRPVIWLGRSRSVEFQTIPIPYPDKKNLKISSKQAKICFEGDRWTIVDPSSANGTCLNGKLLANDELNLLRDNDLINLSQVLDLRIKTFENENFCAVETAPCELYGQPEQLWQEFGGSNAPGPYNALKIDYVDDKERDSYIILVKEISVGGDPENAVVIANFPLPLLGKIIYEGGYYWRNMAPPERLLFNDTPLDQYATVPLRVGDQLQCSNTTITIHSD